MPHAIKTDLYNKWQTHLFSVLFITDIVEAARAPEDPHNICLSEPLAPIKKFPARVRILHDHNLSLKYHIHNSTALCFDMQPCWKFYQLK